MADVFTFDDALESLIRPAGLMGGVDVWKRRRRNPAIVRFVTRFEHKVFPRLRPRDVEDTLERSSHALGYLVKERDTEGFIARSNPPWAMAYLFHACLERHTYRVPTWGEFYAFVSGPAERYWWKPVYRSAKRRKIDLALAHRAACWRLGTAWQSAIRTVYVIATLRHEHGLDVRYHLYPHVELRVDGWAVPKRGSVENAFRILMPNEYEAKKVDPRLIFAGSGIALHDLVVSPRQQRGRVWLPKAREITRLAEALRTTRSSPQLALLG